ncbi:hypothetical protein L195_g032939, partial [Trifolium pratense]
MEKWRWRKGKHLVVNGDGVGGGHDSVLFVF